MSVNRIQKLLFSEYCDFEDMVLVESPFAQTTREGRGIRQVNLGEHPPDYPSHLAKPSFSRFNSHKTNPCDWQVIAGKRGFHHLRPRCRPRCGNLRTDSRLPLGVRCSKHLPQTQTQIAQSAFLHQSRLVLRIGRFSKKKSKSCSFQKKGKWWLLR